MQDLLMKMTRINELNWGDCVNDADFPLPAYAVVDAGPSYRFADWRIAVQVENLLDKKYYPESSGLTRVGIGEPRSWRLSVPRRF